MGRLRWGIIVSCGLLRPRSVELALVAAEHKLGPPAGVVVVSPMLTQTAVLNWGMRHGVFAKCWMPYRNGREIGPGIREALACEALVVIWDGTDLAAARAAQAAHEDGQKLLVYQGAPGGMIRPLPGPPTVHQ